MNRLKSEHQQSAASSASLKAKQLLYRRKSDRVQDRAVIRSKKTAALLQLDADHVAALSSASDPARYRRTVQPGGFIRSRKTAQLLGIPLPVDPDSEG